MDEFHYFADPDRGAAWELPLWRFSRPGNGGPISADVASRFLVEKPMNLKKQKQQVK